MELLIELILEILLDGIVEGVLDGMESKKVPMPLRILLAVVLFALLIGLGVIFFALGMACDSRIVWIVLGVVFVGLLGGLTWKVRKVFRKKNAAD